MEDNQEFETQTVESTPPTSIPEAPEKQEYEPGQFPTVREAAQDALSKAKAPEPTRRERLKAKQGAVSAASQPHQVSQPSEATTAQKAEAPPSLTADERNLWQQFPQEAQKVIQRIEAASRQGVEKLKAQYQGIDSIKQKVAPHLQQLNIPFNDFLEGAGGWFIAMRGPDRVRAAADLLRNLGIDPATVATYAQQAGSQQYPSQYDPRYNALESQVKQITQGFQAQTTAQAKSFIDNWSKDKPHFQTVMPIMHELIEKGLVPVNNGIPDLDVAYQKALRWDDNIWNQIQQTEKEKASQAARTLAAQKKHTGSSLRSGAPSSPVKPNGSKAPMESIRETVLRSMREVS